MKLASLPAGVPVEDSSGRPALFSRAQLAEIEGAYSPDNPAPIVVGHPKANAPAQGWIKGAKVQGDHLFLEFDRAKLKPSFRKALDRDDFKKWSISLYPPDSLSNPTPGKWNIRHLGFLGAASPAFPDLYNHPENDFELAFSTPAGNTRVFVFDFAQPNPMDLNSLKNQDGDLQLADIAKALGVEVSALEELMTQPADDTDPEFSEHPAFVAERRRREALEAQVASLTLQRKRDEARSFCEALVRDGRAMPMPLNDVVEFLVSQESTKTFDFAESKGLTPYAFVQKLLSGLPKQVPLGTTLTGGSDTLDFAEDHNAMTAAIAKEMATGLSHSAACLKVLGGL